MRVLPYQANFILGRPNNAGETYLDVPFGLVGDFHEEIRASIDHMLQNLLIHSNNV